MLPNEQFHQDEIVAKSKARLEKQETEHEKCVAYLKSITFYDVLKLCEKNSTDSKMCAEVQSTFITGYIMIANNDLPVEQREQFVDSVFKVCPPETKFITLKLLLGMLSGGPVA